MASGMDEKRNTRGMEPERQEQLQTKDRTLVGSVTENIFQFLSPRVNSSSPMSAPRYQNTPLLDTRLHNPLLVTPKLQTEHKFPRKSLAKSLKLSCKSATRSPFVGLNAPRVGDLESPLTPLVPPSPLHLEAGSPRNKTKKKLGGQLNISYREAPRSPFFGPLKETRQENLEEAASPLATPPPLETLQLELETTKHHRSLYLWTLVSVVTEGVLPGLSLLVGAYNILSLFLSGETTLGWVGLGLFCFPSILVLLFYLENMLHRDRKLLEICLLLVLGPFLRWLCSARLLFLRLTQGGASLQGHQDLQESILKSKTIKIWSFSL